MQNRIKEYLKFKGAAPYRFCKDLRFSGTFLNIKRYISTSKYLKIIKYFPYINPHWLLTGEREIIQNNDEITKDAEVPSLAPTKVVVFEKGEQQPSAYVPCEQFKSECVFFKKENRGLKEAIKCHKETLVYQRTSIIKQKFAKPQKNQFLPLYHRGGLY